MFHGKETRYSAERLLAGESGIIVGIGQSMTPILKSGQPVRVDPLTDQTDLHKNDIVFCKVNGHFYLHKVLAIRNGQFHIFGKVVEIL